jgi:hypothetical protein
MKFKPYEVCQFTLPLYILRQYSNVDSYRTTIFRDRSNIVANITAQVWDP